MTEDFSNSWGSDEPNGHLEIGEHWNEEPTKKKKNLLTTSSCPERGRKPETEIVRSTATKEKERSEWHGGSWLIGGRRNSKILARKKRGKGRDKRLFIP